MEAEEREAHRLEEQAGRRGHRQVASQEGPGRPARGQPALSEKGAARTQQGQEDRLHLGHADRGPGRPHRRGGRRASSTPTSPASDAGLKVATGGYLGQAVSKADTEISEAIGLAAAVVILLFAFGTATAMVLPIVTRGARARGLAGDHQAARPRHRGAERRAHARDDDRARRRDRLRAVHRHPPQAAADATGMEVRESIARAAATAGGAVVFAGSTVVIALVSLLVRRASRSSATWATAPRSPCVVAVLAAITLLPGAARRARRSASTRCACSSARTHPDDHQPHGWARWARGVVDRPWRSLVASVAILLVLAVPVLEPPARLVGQRRAAQDHHGPPGLRPDHRGLRRRARTGRC